MMTVSKVRAFTHRKRSMLLLTPSDWTFQLSALIFSPTIESLVATIIRSETPGQIIKDVLVHNNSTNKFFSGFQAGHFEDELF